MFSSSLRRIPPAAAAAAARRPRPSRELSLLLRPPPSAAPSSSSSSSSLPPRIRVRGFSASVPPAAAAGAGVAGEGAGGVVAGGSGSSSSSSSSRRSALGVAGASAVAAAGGLAYLHHHVGGGEGLMRTASFYSLAIPKYVEYRVHMMMESPDEATRLFAFTPRRTRLLPLARSVGPAPPGHEPGRPREDHGAPGLLRQVRADVRREHRERVSARVAGHHAPPRDSGCGHVPGAVTTQETCKEWDECPSRPFKVVKSIVESEFGKALEDVFATFEESPVGAASIGQVHRATLKNGTDVVVKVMYPGVEDVFRGDVRTIKMFAQVAQPVHVPPLNEIEKQFMTEFDYRREAEQLDKVRKNMTKADIAGDASRLCAIPRPFLDLCTKRVLVMEELLGDKLVVALKKDVERQAARMERSLGKFGDNKGDMASSFKKEFELGENGPTAEEYDVFIRLLDAKRRASNLYAMAFNATAGWIPGVRRRVLEDKSSLPINHARLIDELLYVHGHQVRFPFWTVAFSSMDASMESKCTSSAHLLQFALMLTRRLGSRSPHPGNILLLGVDEGRPQLGLIDYGQVKVLTKEQRLLFCEIIVALADGDKDRVCELVREAGYKSEKMDRDIMYRWAIVSYDEDNEELTEGKHIQVFMEHLYDRDPIERIPEQYIMASRVSIILRGLGHAVHQSRSAAKAWKPIAERVLREEKQ
ncbi:hypothetical protein ACHAWF_009558 [Thalassiosira exigua]